MRISATDLDAWRYYRDTESASLDALLAQLRHENEPTEAMLAGRAFHRALETCAAGDHTQLQADGYTFDLQLDEELALPAIREVKATRDYRIDGELVTLVGKVDAIDGLRIEDHKLTTHWDAERFLDSYQWRVYLTIFAAAHFRWNVFEGRAVRPRYYRVHAMHQLNTSRYPGLERDVVRELGELARLCRSYRDLSGAPKGAATRYGRAGGHAHP
jgi:hypothetical protein